MIRNRILAAAVLLSASGVAWGDELFEVTATSAADPGKVVTVGGSSVIDLVNNLIESQEQFEPLEDEGFSASLKFAGVDDAIQVSRNAAGTSATIAIPSTGLSRTFTGDDEDDVQDQIEEWVRQEGASEWSEFLQDVNEESKVAVSDGNPRATTAMLAGITYERFALNSSPFVTDQDVKLGGTSEFRLDIAGGVTSSEDGDGYYGLVTLAPSWRFNDYIGFTMLSGIQYRNVEEADIFDVGTVLALPITIVPQRGVIGWTITPSLSGGIGGSYDFASGGIMGGGSLTSALSLQVAMFKFTLGNQISAFEGMPITAGEYEFETDVSQQILKNGVEVTVSDPGTPAFFDGGITHTMFLEEAAVDSYITPTLGGGLRFGNAGGLRLGYSSDFGDDFTAHSATLQLVFAK